MVVDSSIGDLGIITLQSCRAFGEKVDRHIRELRAKRGYESPESFIIPTEEIRFSNGEGKIILKETARGKDIFVLCDVGNYSCTYDLYGYTNRMSPDEHFHDIKRSISAIGGKAARINVLMPMLYASRQDRSKGRESLDCALALQELMQLGVRDVITFDVHNPGIQNAIPLVSFENLYATYDIVRAFMEEEPEIICQTDNLLIISPDVGGMERAIYYSTVMAIDIGMFYKRRDYSRVEKGRNPIVQHDYLGLDLKGKNIMIIDDMISTGESAADIIRELKGRGANKIFMATTFALFTRGVETFQKLYNEGLLTKVYSTNLTYVPQYIVNLPWFRHVDMSEYTAAIIDRLNMNQSIVPVMDSTDRLRADILEVRKKAGKLECRL